MKLGWGFYLFLFTKEAPAGNDSQLIHSKERKRISAETEGTFGFGVESVDKFIVIFYNYFNTIHSYYLGLNFSFLKQICLEMRKQIPQQTTQVVEGP